MKSRLITKFQSSLQFIRFGIVGASGTIITLSTLFILTEYFFIPYWISATIGYSLGIVNNFLLNRRFTFEMTQRPIFYEFIKYAASMFLGEIAYLSSIVFLSEVFSIWYFYSAILSLAVSTLIDFVIAKFWVFKPLDLYTLQYENVLSDKIKIKFIVSCLNEEGNVEKFINELEENIPPNIEIAIVLINNGSLDNTGSIIKKLAEKYNNIYPVQREITLEYGHSIIEELDFKIPFTPDYIGWGPSDNQITGLSTSELMKAISTKECILIKALRYDKDYSFWRKIQSFNFNLIIDILFQKNIQDINGSPKFIKASIIDLLNLKSKGWFLDAEATLKIAELFGTNEIINIYIPFNKRIHGKSKTSWFTAIELFNQIISWRFYHMKKWKKQLKTDTPEINEGGILITQ